MKKLPDYSVGTADPGKHTLSTFHWEAYVAIRDSSFSELLRTTAARRAYFIHVVAELEQLGLVSADDPPLTFADYASGNRVSAKAVKPKEKKEAKKVPPVATAPTSTIASPRRAGSDVEINVKGAEKSEERKAVTLDF